MDAMAISRSGLDVEWQRLKVIAGNLANANSAATASGRPVRALRLISGPRADFDRAVAAKTHGVAASGVAVLSIEPDGTGLRRVYDPTHPQAGPDGFVSYPAIDHAGEMTRLIETSRTYEADLAALNLAHQMYTKALELGRSS